MYLFKLLFIKIITVLFLVDDLLSSFLFLFNLITFCVDFFKKSVSFSVTNYWNEFTFLLITFDLIYYKLFEGFLGKISSLMSEIDFHLPP